MKDGWALITGGSGGIGIEIARCFVRDGVPVALVARNRAKLEQIRDDWMREGARVEAICLDLETPSAAQALFQETERRGLRVDTLVNNAGFGTYGPFAESALESEIGMIRLNIEALTVATRLYLQGMTERRHGRILNVASTAAFQPGPLMSVYYASKAYVLSFSEALAQELEGTGVTVTALCPGPTRTDFQVRAGIENTPLVKGPLVMDAEAVARYGYRAMCRGRRLAVPGAANRALAFGVRLLPRGVVAAAVRRIQETRRKSVRTPDAA